MFPSMHNYYAKFMPQYAYIAISLYNLSQKTTEFDWTINCDTALK